ncbi:hypothetical protein LINPERHAP2_LOCUS4360, partial [Linum perenne]
SQKRLEFLWAKVGRIQVPDVANSFFLVRFSDNDDYKRAAFGGPWKIYDYYISISRWSPTLNKEEPVKKILTWVRLPKLPIHYFNHLVVNRIGNYIGKTVRMDLAMAEGARARYARICVEVDLTKPLLGKFIIENRELVIEYESLGNICFTCGFHGHKEDKCPELVPTEPETQTSEATKTDDVAKGGDAGSWMMVCLRNKTRSPKTLVTTSKSGKGGSHFEVLANPPNDPIPNTETRRETDDANAKSSSSPEADALREVLEKAMKNDKIKGKTKSKAKDKTPPLKVMTLDLT